MNCYDGIRNTSRASVDVVRAYGGTERQVVRTVVLPSALPFIMSGLRLAIGRGLIGVIVAEFFTALTGLGGMLVIFSNNFNTASMFVPVITLVAAGLVLTGLAGVLERRLAAWKETERAT
jgi:NitT/TauT family transport system permease protein